MNEEKDKAESRPFAEQVDAKRGHCYLACSEVVRWHPEFFYVEGWAASGRTQERFHHAWLVGNGTIIDPALPDEDVKYEEVQR
jgi:hypothetical protein